MSNHNNITKEMLNQFSSEFNSDPSRIVIKNAIIKNGIKNIALNHSSLISNQKTFSNEIATGKITSQNKSGRCWIFAGMNTLRHRISEDFKMKDFELSQVQPFFYDKLEKANYFLDNIIETIEEDTDSRIVMWLLDSPMNDGGQWEMFSNLVLKFGLMPKHVMPETFHSSDAMIMNQLLTVKLREDASIIRNLNREGENTSNLHALKTEMLSDIYKMLTFFMGEPPTTFDFEYRDTDGDFHRITDLTPQTFRDRYLKLDIRDYVSLINAPTADKPFDRTFTVQYLGNVRDGKAVRYLNLENSVLKKIALAQLTNGEPVWFGCDVGKMLDRDKGVIDPDLFLYDGALGVNFGLDKAARLDYGETRMTHAMVFTGVNIVDGKPDRWKVENSWGEKAGSEGFLIMSDKWFDEYNFQVVVNKKFLPQQLKDAFELDPIVLKPWDPMGSLALMR